MSQKVQRALLSVSNKTGLVDFARGLHEMGIEIISTGGTMKTLKDAGIPVIYVSEVTGFPEIMDGRVKTLNPMIHGGILANRNNPEHVAAMEEHGIRGIDMVVVNLYPFKETVAKPNVTLDDAVENIDIGGPAMIRASAKNFQHVAVVVNPTRYSQVLEELKATGAVEFQTRMELAREAYRHTADYDANIAAYLDKELGDRPFPNELHLIYEKISDLRYGENPHQQAAYYREKRTDGFGVAHGRQLHGKELSFNNIVDMEAAYSIVSDFAQPAATIIKHTNPCGTAVGKDLAEAYQKAYETDSVSAYGGIIGLNRTVDMATAELISATFIEVVVAPGFMPDALELLKGKANIRLMEVLMPEKVPQGRELDIKRVSGGLVMQESDWFDPLQEEIQVVSRRTPTSKEWADMLFAWKVVKHVKSNAIVVGKDGVTLGVGAGQMNRVGAAQIAFAQAGAEARGAVMASDAYLPFADTVEAAGKAGISAIIQPGGSMRDEDSIKAANALDIVMVFTKVRHFKH